MTRQAHAAGRGWPARAPEQDHLPVPMARGWRVMSVVVAAALAVAVAVVLSTSSVGDDARFEVVPATFDLSSSEPPAVTSLVVERNLDAPDEGRVRVEGDGIDRVDVEGAALCDPVSGAGSAWIEIRFCAPLEALAITVTDGDEDRRTIIAGL